MKKINKEKKFVFFINMKKVREKEMFFSRTTFVKKYNFVIEFKVH